MGIFVPRPLPQPDALSFLMQAEGRGNQHCQGHCRSEHEDHHGISPLAE
jgi:hypothetical protein